MAFVAIDKDGTEWKYNDKPIRREQSEAWDVRKGDWRDANHLENGSIERLIGRKLTWEDKPVELKGEING